MQDSGVQVAGVQVVEVPIAEVRTDGVAGCY